MCLRTITLVCNLDLLYGLIAKDVALESYLYPHSLVVEKESGERENYITLVTTCLGGGSCIAFYKKRPIDARICVHLT